MLSPGLELQKEPKPWSAWQAAGLLFLLAFLPFLPAISGQYTWDDNFWLTQNPMVHSPDGLKTIWNPFAQDIHYYPMVFTMFWAEYRLWGLAPQGFHLLNMLLHAGSAILLWRILKRLELSAAWIGALLWAVHPMQVESVAWVAERKNTLSGLFFFLAVLCYLRFDRFGEFVGLGKRRWPFYWLAAISFLAALLSKTVVAPMPAALLLLVWWKRPTIAWRDIWPLLVLVLLALPLMILASSQEAAGLVSGGAKKLSFTFLQRLIIAGKDIWFYPQKILLPFPLMLVYPRWNIEQDMLGNYLPLAAALAALTALWFFRRRIGKAALACAGVFLLLLAPSLSFVDFFNMRYSFVADHFEYLAGAALLAPVAEGLWFAASWLARGPLENLLASFNKRKEIMPYILAGLIALPLMGMTAFYAALFATNLDLWGWNVAQNPTSAVAQRNFATALRIHGDLGEAEQHMQLALSEGPDDFEIQTGAAELSMEMQQYDRAAKRYEAAAHLRPTYDATYIYLAEAYEKLNRISDAAAAYQQAADLPTHSSYKYFAAAQLSRQSGVLEQAVADYTSGLQLQPMNLAARYNFGNMLLDQGKFQQAAEQYEFITRYQTNNPAVWDNLAAAYHGLGQDDKAADAKKHSADLESQKPVSP